MRIRGLRLMSLRRTIRVLHPASLWRRGSCGRVDDSAGSLLPEPACSELGYCWFDQPLEVGVPDAHGVGVGARPEYYRFVFRERRFHAYRYFVEVPEGGHSAYLAVRECVLKLLLVGEANLP